MNKTLLIFAFLFSINVWGQTSSTNIVNTFVQNLSKWCKTEDPSFKKELLKVAAGENKCFVADEIMTDYAHGKFWGNSENYVLQQYLIAFSNNIPGINVEFSNIKVVPQEMTTYTKWQNDITFVSCDIRVSGKMNYSIKDMFWIQKNKVVYIDKCQTREFKTEDGKTVTKVIINEKMMNRFLEGVKKNSYDFFVGGRYGYSSMTPLNLTITMDQGNFGGMYQLGGLFHFPPYKIQKGDVTKSFSDIFYAVIGPSVSIPYASLNCGFGAISYDLYETDKNQYNSTSKSSTQWKFMIKPTLSIDIPIYEGDWVLSPYAGYNIVPAQKWLNTWEFGVGIKFLKD